MYGAIIRTLLVWLSMSFTALFLGLWLVIVTPLAAAGIALSSYSPAAKAIINFVVSVGYLFSASTAFIYFRIAVSKTWLLSAGGRARQQLEWTHELLKLSVSTAKEQAETVHSQHS